MSQAQNPSPSSHPQPVPAGASSQRAVNWDLLRAIMMFLVVVVHTSSYLGPIRNFDASYAVSIAALICDPVFFVLSGYFALGPMRRTLKGFYINKAITVLFPMVVYSIPVYLYQLTESAIAQANYVEYFTSMLKGGWWFIPTLIPCLVVAPFLSKGLEVLSVSTVRTILKVLGILSLFGIICSTGQWFFERLGVQEVGIVFSFAESLIPPSLFTLYIMPFQFFILGGLFRRIEPSITKKEGNILIVLGLACWALELIWAMRGIPRNDPSYFAVFSSFGVMVLFSRLKFKGTAVCTCISWVAKRSYSVYLIQYVAIAIMVVPFYEQAIFGNVAELAVLARIGIWVCFTLASYLLALATASIIDPLVLNKLQSVLKRFTDKQNAISPNTKNQS